MAIIMRTCVQYTTALDDPCCCVTIYNILYTSAYMFTWNVNYRLISVGVAVLGMHWRTLAGRMNGDAVILAIIVHGMWRRSAAALARFRIRRVPCRGPLLQYLHLPHLLLPYFIVIILLSKSYAYTSYKSQLNNIRKLYIIYKYIGWW